MKQHIILCPYDTILNLKTELKKTKDLAMKMRLKAIILRKNDKTPQEIAESLMISDRSVTGWIKKYNQDGIVGLITKPSGRKVGVFKWGADVFDSLLKEVDRGGYWSIPRMQEWLFNNKGLNIPEQTVWLRMDQLKYSYKSARPCPVQGNKERQEAFKKGASLIS